MQIVKTTTSDGLMFSGFLWEPKEKSNVLILHIHGMAGDPYANSFVGVMAEEYPKAGLAFLSVENRGTHSVTGFPKADHGVKVLGNAYERFEDSVTDIQAWLDLAQMLGYTQVWLQGHSLGCSKIAYFASLSSTQALGLILVSPSDMLGWNMSESNIEAHNRLLREAEGLVADHRGNTILSEWVDGEYPMSADTYLNFFGPNASDAIFNFGKPALGYETLHKIQLPLIAFTGTKDGGITCSSVPSEAMAILERELISCLKKKTIVFEGARHNFAGFEKQITAEVLEFIENA